MTAEQATENGADEDQQDARAGEVEEEEGRLGDDIDGQERWADDETVSDEATCPECGEPVHNLRMTCPKCGHEYEDKEYDDEDAGTEFRAGSEVDDSEVGEKIKDDASGEEKTKPDEREGDDEDEG